MPKNYGETKVDSPSGNMTGRCSSTLANVMWCTLLTPKVNNIMTNIPSLLWNLNLIWVHLQDDLGWITHIGHVTSKASRMLGVVRRNLYNFPESVKETVYFSLVRPHTECANVVWDPYQKNDKKQDKKIQKSAAKFVKSKSRHRKFTSKWLWMAVTGWRRVARLTIMYKIVNDEVEIHRDRYLKPVTRLFRHSNSQGFIQHHCRLKSHIFSFFPRTMIDWKSLPETTVKLQVLKPSSHNYNE